MDARYSFLIAGCLGLMIGLLCPAKVCGQLTSGPSFSTSIRTSSANHGLSVSKMLTYQIPVADRQAVLVSAEYIKASSIPRSLARETQMKAAWKFYATPVTVSYSYALTDPSRDVVPTVNAGVSLYPSRVKRVADVPPDAILADDDMIATTYDLYNKPDFEERIGMGYGAHVGLGLRVDLSRYLFVQAQGRARYVNGFAFTEGNDLGSTFTNLDFSMGFGFKL